MRFREISSSAWRATSRTGLIALCFLAIASPSMAQEGLFAGFEPGFKVSVDLESGVFTDPLPFDVHFFVVDEIADEVTGVYGRFLQFRDFTPCETALAEWESCSQTAPLGVSGTKVPSSQSRDDWTPAARVTRAKSDDGSLTGTRKIFELPVPAIPPNRYFCFEIETFTRPDATTDAKLLDRFRDTVAGSIARSLDDPGLVVLDPTGFPKSMVDDIGAAERLREAVVRGVVNQLQGNERIEVPAGSYFDLNTPYGQLAVDDQVSVSGILGNQVNLVQFRSTLRNRAIPATSALTTLSASARWRIVADVLTRAKAGLVSSTLPGGNIQDAQVRAEQLLTGREAGLDLIGEPVTMSAARVEGRVNVPTTSLERIWQPGVLDLESTPKLVNDLVDIARALEGDTALQKAVGLGEQQLATAITDYCAQPSVIDGGPVPLCPPGGGGAVTQGFFEQLLAMAQAARTAVRDQDLRDALVAVENLLGQRAGLQASLGEEVSVLLRRVLALRASTVASYETRGTWYVAADAGLAWAPDFEDIFSYAGLAVYTRPVNKKAPLRWSDFRDPNIGFWGEFRKRASLVVGLPYDQLDATDELISPVIQDRPALAAFGFRVNDNLRLSGGAILFKEADPNPLIDNEKLAWSPYLSLSIDWNAAQTFSKVFNSLLTGGTAPQK